MVKKMAKVVRRPDGTVIGAPACAICGSTVVYLLFEGSINEQWKCGPNNHRFDRQGTYLSMAGDGERGGVRTGMKRHVTPLLPALLPLGLLGDVGMFVALMMAAVVVVVKLLGTRYMMTENASVGATADTFDAVGNFDLDDDATAILAYIHAAGKVAVTTVEGEHGQAQFFVGSRLVGPFGVGPYHGDGAATNEGQIPSPVDIVPMAFPENPVAGGIGGVNIRFEYSSHVPDPTNASSVKEGLLIWRGAPTAPAGFKGGWSDFARMIVDKLPRSIFNGDILPCTNADSEANGAITTTGATITPLELRDSPSAIVGFGVSVARDAAPTAAAELVGSIDFTSSISGFDTQAIPLPAISATLGTPVGIASGGASLKWPAYIPVFGTPKQQTITPTVRVNATIDATGVGATVFWR
jgi:hypothetical protein